MPEKEMDIVKTEILYTYDAAVNEYERRKHYDWLCHQQKLKAIRQEQKAYREYYLNQKLIGGIWILLVLILSAIIRNPAGLALVLPGIGIIATKNMVIVNEYYWTHGGALRRK